MKKVSLILLMALLALAAPMPTAEAGGGLSLHAILTGMDVVPPPGDPDGIGVATLRIKPGAGQLCYEVSTLFIEPATSAHIHRGATGQQGPVVVELTPPSDGHSTGCVRDLSREVLLDMAHNPENYYVNIRNEPYPHGALRGQLSR